MGEVLISLSLMGVMLALVALLCHDAYLSGRIQEKVTRDTELTLTLLRIAQEGKTARLFQSPPPGGSSSELEFERLDADDGSRLPAVVPVPPPASFDALASLERVRYRVAGRRLLRQSSGGEERERLAGVSRLHCEFLNDGRVRLQLTADLNGTEVQRQISWWAPLR